MAASRYLIYLEQSLVRFYYFTSQLQMNNSFFFMYAEMGYHSEKEWYFFSPRDRKYPNGSRPNRAAGSGYWKATGADKPIGKLKPMGIKKALVFYAGKAPKGVKTNWIMHEYRLANVDRSAGKKNNLRVCFVVSATTFFSYLNNF